MRTVLAAIAIVLVGLVGVEATMQPTARDRVVLVLIFAGTAALAVLAAAALPRAAEHMRTLKGTMAMVAAAAVSIAAAAVVLSASLMFLSPHDLRLTLVSLGLGVGLGLVVAISVAGRAAADLGAIAATASAVGAGDLSVRTGIDRPDEVGDAAAAVDHMIEQLAAARHDRDAAERARQMFMAAVGHDLRTPLTSMRAAIEALQDGMAPDPDRYLAAVHTDLDLLTSMVEDFFLLARIDAGKLDFEPGPVDLTALAGDAADAMRPVAARRRIGVEVQADGRVVVRGGARELSRVVRNLLDNAIRHAPEASVVRIRVAEVGTEAEVAVSDEGPGFPPDFRNVALERFTRADPSRSRASGGAGLGLSIAKGVVEAHGGDITIGPGPGGNVAFRIPA